MGSLAWAGRRREAVAGRQQSFDNIILRRSRCVRSPLFLFLESCLLMIAGIGYMGKPSGGQAFAATHPMFGVVNCHHFCQAFCIAHKSLSCRAKALGVIRWNSQQEVFMTRWESLAAAWWQHAVSK